MQSQVSLSYAEWVSEEDEINERQKMRALTETEIVEAVRRGRREGQTEMVSRYAERIFAMIARQVPDMMDAQELTQDTFLRAFSHIDSYDPRKASLSTWLCRIAYRLTLDFLKRRRPVVVSMASTQLTLMYTVVILLVVVMSFCFDD